MSEKRPRALLRVGAVILKFDVTGLLCDRVVMLNGDSVVAVGAEMQEQRIAEVEKRNECDKTSACD